MTRMFLVALATMIAALTMTPGSASAQQTRERVHVEEHVRVHESYGGHAAMPPGYYQPAIALTQRLIGMLFAGNGARRAGPPVIREGDYCPQGGRLDRLPDGTVACLLSVHNGDPTVHTVQFCPNGGEMGWVPGVDHQVCVVTPDNPCPEGGRLGRVSGVDHEVCVRE